MDTATGNSVNSINEGTSSLNLQTCQFVIDSNGVIISCDPNLSERLGTYISEPVGKKLRDILISLNSGWHALLPEQFIPNQDPVFLPYGEEGSPLAIGLKLYAMEFEKHLFITLSPDLSPQDMLQNSSVTDFHPQSEVVAQLFLRLQLSESRLNNYMQHFPGIFFCQRPDLSFTYIGPSFQETVGQDIEPLRKNGGSFLACICEQDRDFFLQEVEKNSRSSKTFSFTYRLRHSENGSLLYFMDVRTPLHQRLAAYDV